ncbi:hypothetical protein VTJ04DRAFT_8050 [Mycothermus thermophilus]|uniref:uncharacterized protein n=1 Tax=Humicola insolens TaxID=85995 RepID=UPI003743C627
MVDTHGTLLNTQTFRHTITTNWPSCQCRRILQFRWVSSSDSTERSPPANRGQFQSIYSISKIPKTAVARHPALVLLRSVCSVVVVLFQFKQASHPLDLFPVLSLLLFIILSVDDLLIRAEQKSVCAWCVRIAQSWSP